MFFFIVSSKFKVVLMVFVAVCHKLDNTHVKGNFILFAMSIKVMAVLWGKTSQRYFDWTPTFAVLAKEHYFFWFFGQVQNRSDGVCSSLPHT